MSPLCAYQTSQGHRHWSPASPTGNFLVAAPIDQSPLKPYGRITGCPRRNCALSIVGFSVLSVRTARSSGARAGCGPQPKRPSGTRRWRGRGIPGCLAEGGLAGSSGNKTAKPRATLPAARAWTFARARVGNSGSPSPAKNGAAPARTSRAETRGLREFLTGVA